MMVKANTVSPEEDTAKERAAALNAEWGQSPFTIKENETKPPDE